MSEKNPTVHNVTSLPENDTQEGDKKPNFLKRTGTYIKTHKKVAFAAAGMGALVAVSALAGKKSASVTLSAQSPLVIEEAEVTEDTSDDTTVA